MSAYFVTKATIDCIVSAALRYDIAWSDDGRILNPDGAGVHLWLENAKSLRYRYSDADTWNGPAFAAIESYLHRERDDPPWTVVKACRCFDYQACEHPGYEASEASHFVAAVRLAALGHVGLSAADDYTHRAEWEAAPWGIDEDAL
jgi:hypothetical protein